MVCEGIAAGVVRGSFEMRAWRVRASTPLLRRAVPLARPIRPRVPVRVRVGPADGFRSVGRAGGIVMENSRTRQGHFPPGANGAESAGGAGCSTWNGGAARGRISGRGE